VVVSGDRSRQYQDLGVRLLNGKQVYINKPAKIKRRMRDLMIPRSQSATI